MVKNPQHMEEYNKIITLQLQGLTQRQCAERIGISKQAVQRRLQTYSRFTEDIVNAGVPPKDVKHGWIKDDGMSIFIKNPLFTVETFQQALDETVEAVKKHAPKYRKIVRAKPTGSHLLIINLTDLHIGEDSEIALERAYKGVSDALYRAKSYDIDQIIFVGGNDAIHVDTPQNTTTKGTPLAPDMPWHEMANATRELYITLIDQLLEIADVHYIHTRDNHSETLGYMTSQIMQAWYRHSKNITFDVTNDWRKYYQYGDNLIAFAHGHGTKPDNLPLTIAHEASQMWGDTSHRHCYLGHIHHYKSIKYQNGKQYTGLQLEYLPSSTDANDYEKGLGYLTKPSIHTLIHHKEQGQVARLVTNF